ncbi:MAG TPA: hypothetical protein VGD45_07015 [Steroidobacter sp.]|uniref:hypothetical protein n=1 Tax=Steroidobacter sp. TaxID=1978227 RepID=UPI002ED9770C
MSDIDSALFCAFDPQFGRARRLEAAAALFQVLTECTVDLEHDTNDSQGENSPTVPPVWLMS